MAIASPKRWTASRSVTSNVVAEHFLRSHHLMVGCTFAQEAMALARSRSWRLDGEG
jgi:hypothetical protein